MEKTNTETRSLPDSSRWVLNRVISNLDDRLPFPSVAVAPNPDDDNSVRFFWYAKRSNSSFVLTLISNPDKKEDSVFAIVGEGEPFDDTEDSYARVSASMQHLGQMAQSQGLEIDETSRGFSCRVNLSDKTIWHHINTVLLGIQISHSKNDGKDWRIEADKLETQVPATKRNLKLQTAYGIATFAAVACGVGVFAATGSNAAMTVVSLLVLSGVLVGCLASKNLFRLRGWLKRIEGMRHPKAVPGQGQVVAQTG